MKVDLEGLFIYSQYSHKEYFSQLHQIIVIILCNVIIFLFNFV